MTRNKAVQIASDADGPRNLCAMGQYSAAEDVMGYADQLRAVVDEWEREARITMEKSE